jgi:hypothetical protein
MNGRSRHALDDGLEARIAVQGREVVVAQQRLVAAALADGLVEQVEGLAARRSHGGAARCRACCSLAPERQALSTNALASALRPRSARTPAPWS